MDKNLTIEEFQEYFIEIITSLGGKAKVQDQGRKKIIINNYRSFDLKNLYHSVMGNEKDSDKVFDRLKQIVEEIITEEDSDVFYYEIKDRIIPRLFNDKKGLEQNYSLCSVPYVNDVFIAFMIDFGNYTSSISEEMMKGWKINKSELLNASKININKKFKNDVKECIDLKEGLILKPDWLASSYLLVDNLLSFYRKIKSSHKRTSEIVAFIPNRDTLILTEFKNRNIMKEHLEVGGLVDLYPISKKPFIVSMDGVSGL